jgi:hypothetical protein
MKDRRIEDQVLKRRCGTADGRIDSKHQAQRERCGWCFRVRLMYLSCAGTLTLRTFWFWVGIINIDIIDERSAGMSLFRNLGVGLIGTVVYFECHYANDYCGLQMTMLTARPFRLLLEETSRWSL